MDCGLILEEGWPEYLEYFIASASWIRSVYIAHFDLTILDLTGCIDSELL